MTMLTQAVVELVVVEDPNTDLWPRLEEAAIRLSDSLTGGGVHATHGAPAQSILTRAAQRDEATIRSLDMLNKILREIDRRRRAE
jgi:hypothetical protein